MHTHISGSSNRLNILISGAGIAGLTLAWWLNRWGHNVTLLERSASTRGGEYIIDFAGSGWDVAEGMGILPDLKERDFHMKEIVHTTSSGQIATRIQVGELFRSLGLGSKYISINRSDLEDVLYQHVKDHVEIRFGASIETLQEHQEGVRVSCSDRKVEEEFDLLVGADGFHSNVRTLTFGKTHDTQTFLGYYAGAARMPSLASDLEQSVHMYGEPDRQMWLYPLSKKEWIAYFIFKSEDNGYIPSRKKKEYLCTHYSDGGWFIPQVLIQIPEDGSFYLDSVTQIQAPTWHTGRIVLVGDAAWCLTLLSGQGASMAMAGAYILARELQHDRPLLESLRTYEKCLRTNIEETQIKAKKLAGIFVPSSTFSIWLYRWAMKLASHPLLARFFVKQLSAASIFSSVPQPPLTSTCNDPL